MGGHREASSIRLAALTAPRPWLPQKPTVTTRWQIPGTTLRSADLPATRWGAATTFYSTGRTALRRLCRRSCHSQYFTNVPFPGTSPPIPGKRCRIWRVHPRRRNARGLPPRCWTANVYAVGGRSIASSAFAGTTSNQKLLCLNVPTNILTNGGSMIISAGGNGVLDPGETVTVALGVQNSGGPGVVCTGALTTGTLNATGGVTNPSGPQIYGMLCSPPVPTFKNFTFTVDRDDALRWHCDRHPAYAGWSDRLRQSHLCIRHRHFGRGLRAKLRRRRGAGVACGLDVVRHWHWCGLGDLDERLPTAHRTPPSPPTQATSATACWFRRPSRSRLAERPCRSRTITLRSRRLTEWCWNSA